MRHGDRNGWRHDEFAHLSTPLYCEFTGTILTRIPTSDTNLFCVPAISTDVAPSLPRATGKQSKHLPSSGHLRLSLSSSTSQSHAITHLTHTNAEPCTKSTQSQHALPPVTHSGILHRNLMRRQTPLRSHLQISRSHQASPFAQSQRHQRLDPSL